MNTSDLMLSGASLPDAAKLTAHVPGGPSCGAKRISDATAEERAGGAAAFADQLRRIDGEAAERGRSEGRSGVGESSRAVAEAADRAGEPASAVGAERDMTSDAEPSAGTSGTTVLSGEEAASLATDGVDGTVPESLARSTSPSAPDAAATTPTSESGIVEASHESVRTAGDGDEAPLADTSPASGPPSGNERIGDGSVTVGTADADDRADEALLGMRDGTVSAEKEKAATPTDVRDDVLAAAVRGAAAFEDDDAGTASTRTLDAAAADGGAIDIPVADGSLDDVTSTGVPARSATIGDVPTTDEGSVTASMTASAAAVADALRVEEATTSAAVATSAPATASASAGASATAGTSRSGSSPVAGATLVSPSTGGETNLLANARTGRGLSSLPGVSGRTDTAASPATSPVAEPTAGALAASGSASPAGTPIAPEAVSARRTAEGTAVALASGADPTATSSTAPLVVNSPAKPASLAPLPVVSPGASGRTQGVDPVSGAADAAKSDAPLPVLVTDMLRKRQIETTRRVEASRDGHAMNVAAERRLGPISPEASPLADAADGEALAARPTTPSSPGAATPLVSLAAQPPGAALATRVDMSPSPAPIAPHNVSLGSGGDATELAASVRWTLGEGRGQALVNVTPAGLGPVSIRVTLEGDQMNVSILASQSGAREALESLVPRLREQLAAEGHERVQVDVSSGRQDGQGRAGMQARDEGERSGTGRATGDDTDAHDVESLARQGASTHDGTGRGGTAARSMIDAWA